MKKGFAIALLAGMSALAGCTSDQPAAPAPQGAKAQAEMVEAKHGGTYRYEPIYNKLGDKREELKKLLEHTYNAVYLFQFGTHESGQGDVPGSLPMETIAKQDHAKFQSLFQTELDKIEQALKKHGGRYSKGNGPTNTFQNEFKDDMSYYSMIWDLDREYKKLITEIPNADNIAKDPMRKAFQLDEDTELHRIANDFLRWHYLVFSDRSQITMTMN